MSFRRDGDPNVVNEVDDEQRTVDIGAGPVASVGRWLELGAGIFRDITRGVGYFARAVLRVLPSLDRFAAAVEAFGRGLQQVRIRVRLGSARLALALALGTGLSLTLGMTPTSGVIDLPALVQSHSGPNSSKDKSHGNSARKRDRPRRRPDKAQLHQIASWPFTPGRPSGDDLSEALGVMTRLVMTPCVCTFQVHLQRTLKFPDGAVVMQELLVAARRVPSTTTRVLSAAGHRATVDKGRDHDQSLTQSENESSDGDQGHGTTHRGTPSGGAAGPPAHGEPTTTPGKADTPPAGGSSGPNP